MLLDVNMFYHKNYNHRDRHVGTICGVEIIMIRKKTSVFVQMTSITPV